jgi:DNA-binding CsgD family transcriptional regulator
MGFHRDDCRFPNPLWGVFHPPEPRFRFSDVEKDLLEAALLSGTDEEISRSLDLSIWTIKKRWQRVYEKVDRVIPDLLQPIGEGEAPPLAASPSGQRRRHLLDYLRQAPHEIRPALPPGPARAASRR